MHRNRLQVARGSKTWLCSAPQGSSAASCSIKLLTAAGSWRWASKTIGPPQEMRPNCKSQEHDEHDGSAVHVRIRSSSAESQVLFRAHTGGHSPEAALAFASLQPRAGTLSSSSRAVVSLRSSTRFSRVRQDGFGLQKGRSRTVSKLRERGCFEANCLLEH